MFLDCLVFSILWLTTLASQPNPPQWDTQFVKIIDPADLTTCQEVSDAIFEEMGGYCNNGEWSESRYALLFKQGYHDCKVQVGYYTQLLGLGQDPTLTEVREIESPDGCDNALCNFWRGVENLKTGNEGLTLWHVSQAAPMRRVQIEQDIQLGKTSSSGGYFSNVNVKGQIQAVSQQQWFNRNVDMNSWTGGSWSFVHLGCTNAPETTCGNKDTAHTNIPETPIIAEKPYIVEVDGKFVMKIPDYELNKQGYNWNSNETEVPFEQVFVANSSVSSQEINEQLASGIDHILLQPGMYKFDEPIRIIKDRQVVLGIGFPTLQSTNGNSLIEVGDVVGVRVAGLIVEPQTDQMGNTLVTWGTKSDSGSEEEPGLIQDVFARVGGSNNSTETQVSVKTMVQIESSHVIVDHAWLWRADHDIQGKIHNSPNYVGSSLEVNGHHVRAYGLFCEHALGNLVQWNGNYGEVYLYQSELPYDVTQANYADQGYHSYSLGDNVTHHMAYGVGVYSNFIDDDVIMDSGIKAPISSEIRFTNSFTKFLNNYGEIVHVLNGMGDSVFQSDDKDQKKSYLCGEVTTDMDQIISFLQ